MLVTPMKLARQAGVLLLWAATASRGLFAQQLPTSPETMRLRGIELRYVLPDPLFDNSQSALPIKALYVNAWAFGSSKLAQLVRLADSTEINAFVVDVKRSEERRVGEECRSRWSPYHLKKKQTATSNTTLSQ